MPDLSDPLTLLGGFLLGYLLGSIPFGLLFTRLGGLGDIRKVGSGNIGTTNVLRTGRKDLAAATLVGDALKGTVAVLLAGIVGPGAALAAALGAFVGHLYPVWLGFRGGKGVATYLGLLVALAWPVALEFAALWAAVAFLTRYSSLSALLASLAALITLATWGDEPLAWLFVVLTLLLWIKHRENIARLVRGEESRIGRKA